MILKILGTLDILSAIIIWIAAIFHIIPNPLLLLIAFYLLAKGVFFLISADIASIIDVICAIIIFLSLSFSLPLFIPILVSLFLLQKGIFSWLS